MNCFPEVIGLRELNIHEYIGYTVDGVMSKNGKPVFRVKLKQPDGRETVQEYGGYKDEKEARKARKEIEIALAQNRYIVYRRVKFKDFLPYWLEIKIMSKTDSSNTRTTYGNAINKYITPAFGKRNMSSVSGADLYCFLGNVAKISKSEAELCKTILNTAFNYAKELKIVASNPMKGIGIKISADEKGEYHRRRVDTETILNEDQLRILLENAKDTPIYVMLLFDALMGLRISEIIAVKFSDISFNKKSLKIKRQLGKKDGLTAKDVQGKSLTKQERDPKSESGKREILIPDLLYEEILRLKNQYERNRSRRRTVFQDSGYIVCSTYGRPRGRQFHYKYFKELLKTSSLPDVTWHSIRKSYTSILLDHGCPVKPISKNLGHDKEFVTTDSYARKQMMVWDATEELMCFMSRVMPAAGEEVYSSDFAIDVSEYM